MVAVVESASRGAGRQQKGGNHSWPGMEVRIDQHFSSKVYTSGSTISGHVLVNTQKDVSFQDFEVVFTGVVATRLEFVQSYSTSSVRTFLKLRMPISESDLPNSRVFKAGQIYTIPFNFVVPHQLTLSACNHGCTNPAVQDQHLRMPPSLGYWEAEDQAPDMTHIEYSIKAKATAATRSRDLSGSLLEARKLVKVLPSLPEDAPLDITRQDERYCLSKTKTFRKNLVAAKLGELTVTANQPGAVMLSPDGLSAAASAARIDFNFAPATADAAPPKIHSVSAKLTATTFFGSASVNNLPNLGPKASTSSNPCLTYSNTTNLFNRQFDKLQWEQKHVAPARRDSGYETGPPDEEAVESDEAEGRGGRPVFKRKNSSKKAGPPIRHATSVELPISLPINNKKIFLPTFHNCLMSRTYVLQLTLSVGPANTTMSLSVPLQVGVESRFEPDNGEELPSFESAMQEAEADAYLQPRFMQIPQIPMQTGNALPGYNEINRRYIPVA